jgi:hypothetical protein
MTADAAKRPATYADLEAAPPNLVAEIIHGTLETHPRPAGPHSPSTVGFDRGPKRRVYAESELPHLWLVDPAERHLESYALAAGRWLLHGTVRGGEAASLPPFDAISFPLNDLFPFDPPAAPSTTG